MIAYHLQIVYRRSETFVATGNKIEPPRHQGHQGNLKKMIFRFFSFPLGVLGVLAVQTMPFAVDVGRVFPNRWYLPATGARRGQFVVRQGPGQSRRKTSGDWTRG